MLICDYCGAEIEATPIRRKKHVFCSKTCAEEHELIAAGVDDDEAEGESEADVDDDEKDNG